MTESTTVRTRSQVTDTPYNIISNYSTAKENFIARQPMGRLGTAEEIAALVTYLASKEVRDCILFS